MKLTTVAAAIAALSLVGAAVAVAQDGMSAMQAEMKDVDGNTLGPIRLNETPSGMILITADLEGIAPGMHGFHIHETGACDAADGFKSAGGHYAGDMQHGVNVKGGPHPGDLPNVRVGEDGMFVVELFTDRVSLGSDGENPLADEDGSAFIIHAGPDDYESQPAGDAGDRIACGVIAASN